METVAMRIWRVVACGATVLLLLALWPAPVRSAEETRSPAPGDATPQAPTVTETSEHLLGEITITATKTPHDLAEVPGRVDVITKEEIQRTAYQKVDDVLQQLSGINVNRGSGLYSVTSTATMRGLGNDQGRTMVLLDGVPLNKADTGDVNFDRITVGDIERIEVLRGAASALYGSNAMGGVINIITKKPTQLLEGTVSATGGTMGTYGGDLALSGRLPAAESGFFYGVTGHYLDSSGYMSTPPASRTTSTVNRFFEEGNGGLLLGYDFNPLNTLSFRMDYYDNLVGEGTKIRAPNGVHRDFGTWAYSANYTGGFGDTHWQLKGFYNNEDYRRVSESQKGVVYTRFDVQSDRTDMGLDGTLTLPPLWANVVTLGADIRDGKVDGTDTYRTSPDWTNNRGKLLLSGVWLQDELPLFADRLRLAAGIRFDYARFSDGAYFSTLASYSPLNGSFPTNTWTAWSPHASARYAILPEWGAYVSYNHGFRASILNDLTRSGIMYGLYTIANPTLKPETIDTYEIGTDYQPRKDLRLSASLYDSEGRDFLYYVPTGGTLNGTALYQRQNVGKVRSYGAEFDVKYTPIADLILSLGYTTLMSEIKQFSQMPQLEGQQLTNNPRHQIKGQVTWLTPYVNVTIMPRYKSSQMVYTNQVTSSAQRLAGYFDLDAKLWKEVAKGLTISLSGQNLTNKRYTESTSDMSPGLFVFAQVEYRFGL